MTGPARVCEVPGCQKAVGMLLTGHHLCPAHGDAVIDWAREAGKNVNSLSGDEVGSVVNGGSGSRFGAAASARKPASHRG